MHIFEVIISFVNQSGQLGMDYARNVFSPLGRNDFLLWTGRKLLAISMATADSNLLVGNKIGQRADEALTARNL